MKKTIIFLITFAFIQFVFWYGGVDVFERNPMNAYLLVIGIFCAWIGSIFGEMFP
jgi:hypothetical protein